MNFPTCAICPGQRLLRTLSCFVSHLYQRWCKLEKSRVQNSQYKSLVIIIRGCGRSKGKIVIISMSPIKACRIHTESKSMLLVDLLQGLVTWGEGIPIIAGEEWVTVAGGVPMVMVFPCSFPLDVTPTAKRQTNPATVTAKKLRSIGLDLIVDAMIEFIKQSQLGSTF